MSNNVKKISSADILASSKSKVLSYVKSLNSNIEIKIPSVRTMEKVMRDAEYLTSNDELCKYVDEVKADLIKKDYFLENLNDDEFKKICIENGHDYNKVVLGNSITMIYSAASIVRYSVFYDDDIHIDDLIDSLETEVLLELYALTIDLSGRDRGKDVEYFRGTESK